VYFVVTPGSVQWTGDNTGAGSAAPTADLTVKAGASLAASDYVAVAWNGGAVQDVVDPGQASGGSAVFRLTGWPGIDMAAGKHSDVVTISACRDSACTQPIAGSGVSVAVSYTVTGNVDPGTRVSWPNTDYSYDLHGTDATPVLDIVARVDHVPPEGLHVMYSVGSGALIQGVTSQYSPVNADTQDAHFAIQLKAPSSLTQGQYLDTVTLTICFDSACARPVPSGPFTAHVAYHMRATAGVDYTLRNIDVAAADMRWNGSTQKLEVATYGTSTVLPQSLAELDPASGTFGRSVALYANPQRLAVTDDGQYSYVLEIGPLYSWWLERVRNSDFTIDQTWPLGTNSSGFLSIQAVPGDPHAVLLQDSGIAGNTLSILDDGLPRANSLDQSSAVGADFRAYFWSASGSLLYAYQPSTNTLLTIPVSAAGLGPDTLLANVMLVDTSRSSGFFVAYSGGLVFGVDGHVFDPVALTMQTPFIVDAMPYKDGLVVDPTVGRVYYVLDFGGYATIDSFAIAGRDRYWRIQLPVTNSDPYGMIRFGTDGLAFLSNNSVVLLNGAIVAN
jgi:hypothetical protein